MSRFKPWAANAARSLAAHLDRLGDTLDRLNGRLREAVAEAVSGSTAGAVKDAVLAAMLAQDVAPAYEPQGYRTSYRPYEQSPYRDGQYRPNRDEDPYRPAWQRDPYAADDDDPDRYEPEARVDDSVPQHSPEPSPEAVGRRWGQALAVGCQAAAWWLRRKSNGRFAGLAALGVGAVAGVAAYFVGPVLAAGAGLAGSALSLNLLSDAARNGAALLFGVGASSS
jgi:hypothetical protein